MTVTRRMFSLSGWDFVAVVDDVLHTTSDFHEPRPKPARTRPAIRQVVQSDGDDHVGAYRWPAAVAELGVHVTAGSCAWVCPRSGVGWEINPWFSFNRVGGKYPVVPLRSPCGYLMARSLVDWLFQGRTDTGV